MSYVIFCRGPGHLWKSQISRVPTGNQAAAAGLPQYPAQELHCELSCDLSDNSIIHSVAGWPAIPDPVVPAPRTAPRGRV